MQINLVSLKYTNWDSPLSICIDQLIASVHIDTDILRDHAQDVALIVHGIVAVWICPVRDIDQMIASVRIDTDS